MPMDKGLEADGGKNECKVEVAKDHIKQMGHGTLISTAANTKIIFFIFLCIYWISNCSMAATTLLGLDGLGALPGNRCPVVSTIR